MKSDFNQDIKKSIFVKPSFVFKGFHFLIFILGGIDLGFMLDVSDNIGSKPKLDLMLLFVKRLLYSFTPSDGVRYGLVTFSERAQVGLFTVCRNTELCQWNLLQWKSVNTNTKGACNRFIWVSVLSGLSQLTVQTQFISYRMVLNDVTVT